MDAPSSHSVFRKLLSVALNNVLCKISNSNVLLVKCMYTITLIQIQCRHFRCYALVKFIVSKTSLFF